MAWQIAAAAAAPILGGLIGNMMGAGDRASAQAAMANAMAQFEALGMPPETYKPLILKEFQSAGILTPELEKDMQIAESQVANIKEDQALRGTQMQALSKFMQVGKEGLRPEDRLALLQARNAAQTDAEAKRQQVLQNMQARGLGGSGAELVAALGAGQNAENLQSEEGMKIAALASQNALGAIREAGSLGGQIRGQDFDVAQTKASAADRLAEFNLQNAIAQQQRNVFAKNQAQLENLSNAQRIANQNVDQANEELRRQQEARRAYYNQQLERARGMAGQYQNQAGYYQDESARKGQIGSSIGQGVGQGFGTWQQYNTEQATKAENKAQADRMYRLQKEDLALKRKMLEQNKV